MNYALDFYPLPILRPCHHLRGAHSWRRRWHVRFTDHLYLGLFDDRRKISRPTHACNVKHSSRVNGQYGFRRNRNKNAPGKVANKKRTVAWIDVRVVVGHYGAQVHWILPRRLLCCETVRRVRIGKRRERELRIGRLSAAGDGSDNGKNAGEYNHGQTQVPPRLWPRARARFRASWVCAGQRVLSN